MSFAVARTFSILGHPLVVLPVGVLLPMLRHAEPVDALMTSAGFIGFAAAVMLWSRRKVKHGAWEHVDASRLDERRSLNRFLLPLILAGTALAWVLSSPPRVVMALSAAAGIVLAAMLVSRWCKLSLHVAFAVFAAGLLWPLGAAYSAMAAAFAVAIAWSRLKLSRHAPRDLIAGALAGALAIAACQLLAPLAGG